MTARIREFVVDTFLLGDDDGFDDDDSLIEGGIVDSTGVMELVSFLEETYGIAIEDRELVAANLDSITRLRAFVDGKVAAAAPAARPPWPRTPRSDRGRRPVTALLHDELARTAERRPDADRADRRRPAPHLRRDRRRRRGARPHAPGSGACAAATASR